MRNLFLSVALISAVVPALSYAESASDDSDMTLLHDRLVSRAKGGDSDAMIDLAAWTEMPLNGGHPDMAGALDLYQKAADKGDRFGRRRMCTAYLLGEGRPKDVVKAAPYCNALGVKDDFVGIFWAAYDYQNGVSGPADEAEAMKLYLQAEQLGSGDAAVALGRKAIALGKPDMARQWFRRGVYLGSTDAMAELAAMVEAGQGGPADAVEARWLYHWAAERGNAAAQQKIAVAPVYESPIVFRLDISGPHAVVLTHTYSGAKGPVQETLDSKQFTALLTSHFPTAQDNLVEGDAAIECYVTGENVIDACVIKREFPIGFGFGGTLATLFSGRMTVSAMDAKGEPTAHRLLTQGVRWRVG